MSQLSSKAALDARSTPEIVGALTEIVARLRARRFDLGPLARTAKGRNLTRELFLNALAAWFAKLPLAEQERVMREGTDAFAALVAQGAADAPAVARTLGVQAIDASAAAGARAKGKRAPKPPSNDEPVGQDERPHRKGTPTPRR